MYRIVKLKSDDMYFNELWSSDCDSDSDKENID